MSSRLHRMQDRKRPETFGLSTLDTVSCALGGAIVLLMLMAALTDPASPVKLRENRNIFQAGDAEAAKVKEAEAGEADQTEANENLLKELFVLFIDYDSPVQHTLRLTGPCAAGHGVTSGALQDARVFFADPQTIATQSHGLYVRTDQPNTSCKSLTIRGFDSTPCTITLAAGAHAQVRAWPSGCPRSLRVYQNNDRVFRFTK